MKKKLLVLSALCTILVLPLQAAKVPGADTCWTKSGNFGLNLTQVSFSNWSAGGENALGFTVSFNYSADMKKGKSLWQNRLETTYGLNKTESEGTKKTNDKLYLSSNYGYNIGKAWYLSAMANLSSQFAEGFDYTTTPKTKISGFMSPGYILTGIGIKWNPKPFFTATFSAVTWRGVIVKNVELREKYGVDLNRKIKNEFGGDLKLEYKQDIMKNVNLYSRLQLFSNYLDDPQNVDVNWDVQLVMTVNKWLSANITTNMIYDNDTKVEVDSNGKTLKGARLQFKEALGVGLTINF